MSETPENTPQDDVPNNVRALREGFSNDAGRVVEVEPTEPPQVPYVDRLRRHLRRGPQVLDKPPVTWLVEDWIPNGSVVVLYGPPGVGKSFVVMDFAFSVASGSPWAGRHVEPTTVLYVAAERAAVLGERQEAWVQHHRKPIPERFVELSAAPLIRNTEALAALVDIIRDVQPGLVIIDTLAQVTLGTAENDGKEWGEVVQALNVIRDATNGGSVLVIHHSGKDTTKGARGHTVLLGSVDATYELSGDAQAIKLQVDKLNAGAKPMPEWCKLEPVALDPHPADPLGRPRSSAVVVSSSGRDATNPRRNQVLELLEGAYADVGMTRTEVEQALDVHKNTAQQVLKALKDDGLVVCTGKNQHTRYFRNRDQNRSGDF